MDSKCLDLRMNYPGKCNPYGNFCKIAPISYLLITMALPNPRAFMISMMLGAFAPNYDTNGLLRAAHSHIYTSFGTLVS